MIARAVKNVARGTVTSAPPAAIEARDLLADLAEILGDELAGVQRRDLLDDVGVRVTNTGNVLRLDPADLRRVLARAGDLAAEHLSRERPGGPLEGPA